MNKDSGRSKGSVAAWLSALVSVAAAFLLAVPVAAQAAAGATNEAVYMYRGADRDQRLLEQARKEGSLVLYTSLALKQSQPLAKAFEKKYGVKVELWRALSSDVLQRTIAEGRARRYSVDVVETNGPEMEAIGREKLLSEFYSPYFADLPASAIPPSRMWVTDRLEFYAVAYNTNMIKRADIPKSYEGFLDPKWRGKIGIEATDSDWMAAIVNKWGTERGMKFFRALAAMKPDMRKGHILLAQMVAAGEVPVALSAYNANVVTLKRRGGPIDWIPVDPVVGRPQGIGLARHAPHPHAALLFADYVLSPEGQQLLSSMGRVPASLKVKSDMNNFPYVMINPATVLDENQKWEDLWDKLFLNK